ncbi:hypothetical protein NA56DRAFT_700043 [Hyaloscypha hepaticicola]|uniref:Uncharacterized protein n=1 Tax=Hyaloscypha hepaticicola TaxID=2082293 RepID=A0A2J6QDS7_9HELO|nr:hypothetical protein NA56DRAFT_700043 [Hyaloscypha hepaticicola]
MASTNPNNTIQREERDQRDERRLILPENRVFGPPCRVNIDWNAALHQQRLLATLPYPSSHEKAYTKWLQGHRMEPAWTDLNFLERAEWVQFYFDMTTEDLKVKELESEKIQDEDEAEATEYVQMAQRTIIPLKQKRESDDDTKEPKFYYEDPGAASNASASTTNAGSPSYEYNQFGPRRMPQNVYYGTGYATAAESSNVPGPVGTLMWPRTQELIAQERRSKKRKLQPGQSSMNQQPAGHSGQFGPPMTQAPMYNQFGPPARSAPSISQQTVYNQFPVTGPVYLNQYRGPYQGPKQG